MVGPCFYSLTSDISTPSFSSLTSCPASAGDFLDHPKHLASVP